ncbi:MAG TPA: sugar phosphate isomerase/epimerase family protein [Thermoleophilaceae bacterium]|nr:sugar phosphate isomerase/epimerase family protein [Thermoleophilaceae bacterium]
MIRDLSIEAVDIFVLSGSPHTAAEAVLADPAGVADAVKERVQRHGLKVADVFAIFGEDFEAFAPNHPDEAVRGESRRQFEALVAFSRRLEAPGMTVLPGVPFDGVDERESLALAASELEQRAKIAADAGLRLSVEPHLDSIIPTPAGAEPFLERTEEVGLTLDVSHFTYQGIAQGESDPLIARTRHVHLRQARQDVMQARVREGTIDFPALRDRLLAAGYDAYFGLEYQWEEHWLDFTHVDCITETAELRDLLLDGTSEAPAPIA